MVRVRLGEPAIARNYRFSLLTEKPNCATILSAILHPDTKLTLVAMSERTGMCVSQVADEVLYTGLIEMQELPEFDEWWGGSL